MFRHQSTSGGRRCIHSLFLGRYGKVCANISGRRKLHGAMSRYSTVMAKYPPSGLAIRTDFRTNPGVVTASSISGPDHNRSMP